jgi:glycosyltransferase involved in cell wall biosynthesis
MKINVFTEKPGWITNRLAKELVLNSDFIKLYFGFRMKYKILHTSLIRQKNPYSAIHYYIPYYLAPAFKQNNVITISCLTHYESDNVFKRNGWEKALTNSDYFVSISKITYDQAINHGVDKSKIRLIHYGAGEIYRPTFNILICGAPGKRKGQDFLNEVIEKCAIDDSVVWKSASESGWGLETICKNAADLRHAYSWADLVFVPSDLEGAHTATIEAIFSGVPVLSRETGWAKNELKDYVTLILTSDNAAQFILKEAKKKNRISLVNKASVEEIGFSYKSWRHAHHKLFSQIINLNSAI